MKERTILILKIIFAIAGFVTGVLILTEIITPPFGWNEIPVGLISLLLAPIYFFIDLLRKKIKEPPSEKIEIWIENDIPPSDAASMYIYFADENFNFQGIIFAISVNIKNFTSSKTTIISWLLEIPSLNITISKLSKKTTINVFPNGVLGLKKSNIFEFNELIVIEPRESKKGILLRFIHFDNQVSDLQKDVKTILKAKTVDGDEIKCECILKRYEIPK